MDFDNLFILLIIFSFIARAVGDALKGSRKGPGGPQRPGAPRRPPQQRLPQPRPQTLPQGRRPQAAPREPEPVAQRTQPPETAADLIPSELWEILTGQKRPPAPPPAPVPFPIDEDDDEERIPDEESLIVPEVSREDEAAAELIRRRREVVARRERGPEIYRPKIVSLETEPLSTAARHAAFHEKHDAQAPAKVLRREPVPGLARLAGAEPGALRRAIILNEVLGRPRGLE